VHPEHMRDENEEEAMSKLRLLIKRPDSQNTCIPVIVDSADLIGDCLSALIDHLNLPRRDGLGRELAYSLRPLFGRQPLPTTRRFADVHLPFQARLVLEVRGAYAAPRPLGSSVSRGRTTGIPGDGRQLTSSHQLLSRRTFMAASVLTGCAISGLLTGVATAYAVKRSAFPLAPTRPAASPTHAPDVLKSVLHFSGHRQMVRALVWSPDAQVIASGADDGWLLLWTLDGQVQQRIAHPAAITALAWSPAGKLLASGAGTSVRFFDAPTATLRASRSVHTGQVTSLAWSKAPGHPLVSGSLDKRAIVWETHHYQPQAIFTRHTTAIEALTSQPEGGTTIASSSQGGVVRIWHVDTLTELHGFYQDAAIPLRTLAFAPTGTQLAAGGEDGQVRLWNNGLVCQEPTFTAQGAFCADQPLRFRAHTAPLRAISWSPDARFLATGSQDGTLALWAAPPGAIPTLVTQIFSADPIAAVAWSPSGGYLAVASGKTVTIWNVRL
jgi:WD40 repeat protein